MKQRDPRSGVSLLNTLVVIAVGASLTHTMLTDQDIAIDRLGATQDHVSAKALADGGIAAVASALREDFLAAPEQDHLQEPWAKAAQQAIDLDFGTFEVDIKDARGRFDLNALTPANLAAQRVFAALLAELDLPQVLAPQITQIVQQQGPLLHPDDLRTYGLANADLTRLAPFIATFPEDATININAAKPAVLTALFGDPIVAQNLAARRDVKGFLDAGDLAAFGVILPSTASFASDTFDVRAQVTLGAAKVVIHRRLIRNADTGTIRTLPGT